MPNADFNHFRQHLKVYADGTKIDLTFNASKELGKLLGRFAAFRMSHLHTVREKIPQIGILTDLSLQDIAQLMEEAGYVDTGGTPGTSGYDATPFLVNSIWRIIKLGEHLGLKNQSE